MTVLAAHDDTHIHIGTSHNAAGHGQSDTHGTHSDIQVQPVSPVCSASRAWMLSDASRNAQLQSAVQQCVKGAASSNQFSYQHDDRKGSDMQRQAEVAPAELRQTTFLQTDHGKAVTEAQQYPGHGFAVTEGHEQHRFGQHMTAPTSDASGSGSPATSACSQRLADRQSTVVCITSGDGLLLPMMAARQADVALVIALQVGC